MLRREALKIIVAAAHLNTNTNTNTQISPNQGWVYNPQQIKRFIRTHKYPFLSQQNKQIKGTGKGKKAFLHKALEQVASYTPYQQGDSDCVAVSAARGVDILKSVQIANGKPQRWEAFVASEPIYAGSRVEIGGGKLGNQGGSLGVWAAEWLTRYGNLFRKPYPGYDFTEYNARLTRKLGVEGCPDHLEPLTKAHPVKEVALCRTYYELCDSIYNGYPVMVCSNVGFGNRLPVTRDKEGFLRRSGVWWHAMLFAAYDDEYVRPGALCFNSWGPNWVQGPTRGPQPAGTFWVDKKVVDAMLQQMDSFSFSGFVGFPNNNVPPYILY